MGTSPSVPDDKEERINRLNRLDRQIKQIREKMELETHTFIKAAKTFTSEWVRQELEKAPQPKSKTGENPCQEKEPFQKRSMGPESGLKTQIARIPPIVQEQLNRDEYWIHRKELCHVSTAPDYLKFEKEKTRKALTTAIRMFLGCAAELLSDPEYAATEEKVWLRERGRRKHVCFLRFSEEMEDSLARYFSMLKELYSLDCELKFYELRFYK